MFSIQREDSAATEGSLRDWPQVQGKTEAAGGTVHQSDASAVSRPQIVSSAGSKAALAPRPQNPGKQYKEQETATAELNICIDGTEEIIVQPIFRRKSIRFRCNRNSNLSRN